MRSTLYAAEREKFRTTVRDFFTERVMPEYPSWKRDGNLPREFWLAAGELGLLSLQIPKPQGGVGRSEFGFNVIVTEEAAALGLELDCLRIHADVAVPTLARLADREQGERWLSPAASGQTVIAIAIPHAHLTFEAQTIAARAVRDRNRYIVFGAGLYIPAGAVPDLIIAAVRTHPSLAEDGWSLLAIERDAARLTIGTRPAGDRSSPDACAELIFDDVVVSADNLLGESGHGLNCLRESAAQQQLSSAVRDLAAARHAAGAPVGLARAPEALDNRGPKGRADPQHTDNDIGRVQLLLDGALRAHDHGQLPVADAMRIALACRRLRDQVMRRRSPSPHSDTRVLGGSITETSVARTPQPMRQCAFAAGTNPSRDGRM